MTRLVALVACATLACESSDGGGSDLGAPVARAGSAEPAKARPGFADDIAKQITGETPAASELTPAKLAAGSATGSATGSAAGSATGSTTHGGSAAGTAPGSASAAANPIAKPGSAARPAPTAPTAPAAPAPPAPAGSAAPAVAGSAAPAGRAVPVATAPKPNVVRGATAALKLPPQNAGELAKIKLSLGPNWQRDAEGAGTVTFALTEPSKGQIVLFLFEYGYELESAPVEREAYKKWLGDNKVLTNLVDRQRGVSWYIEGIDAGGKPAFRYVAQFGPKKLVCGGSLYRDAEGNRLGDLRDEIVLRAKQICETVTL